MEYDSKKIIKLLIKDGFEFVSSRGSHHKYRQGNKTIVIPHPKKDIPIGTVRNIYKMAGWLK